MTAEPKKIETAPAPNPRETLIIRAALGSVILVALIVGLYLLHPLVLLRVDR